MKRVQFPWEWGVQQSQGMGSLASGTLPAF